MLADDAALRIKTLPRIGAAAFAIGIMPLMVFAFGERIAAAAVMTNHMVVRAPLHHPNKISEADLRWVPFDPQAKENACLVRAECISVDPYLTSAFHRTKIGQPMRSGLVGMVEPSDAAGCPVGQHVEAFGIWAVQQYLPPAWLVPLADTVVAAHPEFALGPAGMPGQTAYMGVTRILKSSPGEVCYVSGAAGAVGTVAVQLLKRRGCKVIGSAGSDEEVQLLTGTLGADAAFNYRRGPSMFAQLREALDRLGADGIDATFDNVGGETLEAAIKLTRDFGRVAVCGAISQYLLPPNETYAIRGLNKLVDHSILLQGFLISDYAAADKEAAAVELRRMIDAGELNPLMTVVKGGELLPAAFASLFQSAKHVGKLVVRMSS